VNRARSCNDTEHILAVFDLRPVLALPDRELAERIALGNDGMAESRRAWGPRREAYCRRVPKEGARRHGQFPATR